MIYLRIVWVFVVFLGWSFLIWRRFRVDYDEKAVVKVSAQSAIAAMLFGGLVGRFEFGSGGFSIWASLLGMLGWVFYVTKKQNFDFWEWLDFLMLGYLWAAALLGINFIFNLAGIILGTAVYKNYRKFNWFKSGKLGLTALFVLAWVGVGEIITGFKTGTLSQYAGVWLLTGAAVAIYLRSGIRYNLVWPKIKK